MMTDFVQRLANELSQSMSVQAAKVVAEFYLDHAHESTKIIADPTYTVSNIAQRAKDFYEAYNPEGVLADVTRIRYRDLPDPAGIPNFHMHPRGELRTQIPLAWLSSVDHAQFIETKVRACSDVVPFMRKPDGSVMLVLSKRSQEPVQEYWWHGGEIKKGHSSIEQGVIEFEGDTKIRLDPQRFIPLPNVEPLMKEQSGERQGMWHQTLNVTHAVEITEDELAQMRANIGRHNSEFEPDSTILADWERLKQPDIWQPVRDVHTNITRALAPENPKADIQETIRLYRHLAQQIAVTFQSNSQAATMLATDTAAMLMHLKEAHVYPFKQIKPSAGAYPLFRTRDGQIHFLVGERTAVAGDEGKMGLVASGYVMEDRDEISGPAALRILERDTNGVLQVSSDEYLSPAYETRPRVTHNYPDIINGGTFTSTDSFHHHIRATVVDVTQPDIVEVKRALTAGVTAFIQEKGKQPKYGTFDLVTLDEMKKAEGKLAYPASDIEAAELCMAGYARREVPSISFAEILAPQPVRKVEEASTLSTPMEAVLPPVPAKPVNHAERAALAAAVALASPSTAASMGTSLAVTTPDATPRTTQEPEGINPDGSVDWSVWEKVRFRDGKIVKDLSVWPYSSQRRQDETPPLPVPTDDGRSQF